MVLRMPSGSRSGNFLTSTVSISSAVAPVSRLTISTMEAITPGLAAPVLPFAVFAAVFLAAVLAFLAVMELSCAAVPGHPGTILRDSTIGRDLALKLAGRREHIGSPSSDFDP